MINIERLSKIGEETAENGEFVRIPRAAYNKTKSRRAVWWPFSFTVSVAWVAVRSNEDLFGVVKVLEKGEYFEKSESVWSISREHYSVFQKCGATVW